MPSEELAIVMAKAVARKYKIKDYGELVTPAWQGIIQARKNGFVDKAGIWRAVIWCIGKYKRQEYPAGARVRDSEVRNEILGKRVKCDISILEDGFEAKQENDSDKRKLELWAETKKYRTFICTFKRLIAYLHFVEGIIYKELGSIFNLNKSSIKSHLIIFKREVQNSMEKENEDKKESKEIVLATPTVPLIIAHKNKSNSKLAVLQRTMFDSISAKDVEEIMDNLTKQAKQGNIKAISVFLGLLKKG